MAGSKLFGFARQASEYARRRGSKAIQQADERIDQSQQSQYFKGRRSLVDRLKNLLFGSRDQPDQPGPTGPLEAIRSPQPGLKRPGHPVKPPGDMTSRPGAPPVVPPPEEFDQIQLLGRDAGYDQADFDAVMHGMRLVSSSNVYGYFFEREQRNMGILYVTFLETLPNGKRGTSPGPTYAYYNVPVRKAIQFQKASEESAGHAVWDYLRVRGSVFAHQHMYRLVHVSGEYVPRKATALGYKARAVPNLGIGRRGFRRNTLQPITFSRNDPRRGDPIRGEPDRGRPG